MNCAKSMVGRVIGKQGETIKQLQRNTGANVQIDQSQDPCIITVTGQTANINNAMRDINNIINDTGTGASGYGRGAPSACCYSFVLFFFMSRFMVTCCLQVLLISFRIFWVSRLP
jgi:polyribonucleotide nucleotidyltransferase